MTAQEIVELITQGGLVVALILVLIAGAFGWWVYGWQHRKTLEQLDKSLDLNVRLTRTVETLMGIKNHEQH